MQVMCIDHAQRQRPCSPADAVDRLIYVRYIEAWSRVITLLHRCRQQDIREMNISLASVIVLLS